MAYFHGDFRSAVLGMDTGLGVVLPHDRPPEHQKSPIPVIYLLHGLGQNASVWVRNCGVERYARKYGVAFIMPEVGRSFYSNMAYGGNYFDYITMELPEMVNKFFSLPQSRENTYIAGLSMGGYGAFKCGLTYPEKYRGIASFSGLMDIDFLLTKDGEDEKRQLIGLLGDRLEIPPELDLYKIAAKLIGKKELPSIYFSCGTEDYLRFSNQHFTDFLQEAKILHKYEQWRGEHDWGFWQTSLERFLEGIWPVNMNHV